MQFIVPAPNVLFAPNVTFATGDVNTFHDIVEASVMCLSGKAAVILVNLLYISLNSTNEVPSLLKY